VLYLLSAMFFKAVNAIISVLWLTFFGVTVFAHIALKFDVFWFGLGP